MFPTFGHFITHAVIASHMQLVDLLLFHAKVEDLLAGRKPKAVPRKG